MFGFLSKCLPLAATVSAVLLRVVLAQDIGVCYSPFHSASYFESPAETSALLQRDMETIAASNFQAIRTFHAQFHGVNIIHAVREAGLKVAIGIQMLSADKQSEYEYLEEEIAAAIEAAAKYPEHVVAIYAGNENLKDGEIGVHSAADIVAVMQRIRGELQGTRGAQVPVGTVQRLEEWLYSPDAEKLAAAADVVGANIYPFFSQNGELDMFTSLDVQWAHFEKLYQAKARLTETGWPSAGSPSPQGNHPSLANAEAYFHTFEKWAVHHQSKTPFYFMMFDRISESTPDYETHFGLLTASGVAKFALPESLESSSTSATGSAIDGLEVIDVPSPTETSDELINNLLKPFRSGDGSSSGSDVDDIVIVTDSPVLVVDGSDADGTVVVTDSPVFDVDGSGADDAVGLTDSPAVPDDGSSYIGEIVDGSNVGGTDVDASGSGSMINDEIPSSSTSGSSSASSDGSMVDGKDVIEDIIDAINRTNHRHTQQPQRPHPAPVPNPPVHKPQTERPDMSPEERERVKELEAQRARSKMAREVSGKQDSGFVTLAAFIGIAGVAAVAVVAVYARRRAESQTNDDATMENASDHDRDSTSSVYDDPLGTRFSSIVMITPNGDGVCIL